MKFSYNWLKEYLPKIPKPEKLAEFLTLHSFEVKEVIRKGGDFVLDIDVLPNRGPDCFSHIGIARECSALTNFKFQISNSKLKEDKNSKAKDFVKVEVKNKEACPRYTARVVTDVKVDPSPKWMQKRLRVCGLRPINNIVDIANYVMLETGQPLHAFNEEKLSNKKIVVRFARKGEKIITLDGEKYDFDGNILVIADVKKPVAIAGIKGGRDPGIDKKTKIVVIESANFNPQVIRRGSQRLNLKTDASLRFEHGIDPNLTEIAINRASYLIQKIAGGKVAQGIVDVYPKKVFPKQIRLDLYYVWKLLGVEISRNTVLNILKSLQIKTKSEKSNILVCEIPTFRRDLVIPEDLIEEIGRVAGYEKLPAIFPQVSLIPPKRNFERFWEEIAKNSLKEAGFSETYNYSFIGEGLREIFGYNKEKELIEIENPVSEEYKYLRPSLIPNLLKNTSLNLRNFDDFGIFELGKIFFRNKKQIREKRMLTGLIAKKGSQGSEDFYKMKGVIDSLVTKMGISNVWYDEWKISPEESKISLWDLKRAAEIKVDQKEIGFLGAISPKVLSAMKIKNPVFVFDLNFDLLSQLAVEEHEFRPLSRYPAAIRDLAVLVPRAVKVEEVLNLIEQAGGILVRDVDLFDMYEGEELPGGKKNLAFRIVYQAEDRTLESREIEKIHQNIIKNLEKNINWEVRK